MMCPAVGGVLGGVIAPNLVARFGQQTVFLAAQVVFILHPLAFVLTSSPVAIGAGMAVGMFAGVAYNVVTVSYRQRQIPDALLGRVNALYRLFGWGMMPVGMMIAGAVVAVLEPTLGREIALRMPYLYGAAGLSLLLTYSAARIRL